MKVEIDPRMKTLVRLMLQRPMKAFSVKLIDGQDFVIRVPEHIRFAPEGSGVWIGKTKFKDYVDLDRIEGFQEIDELIDLRGRGDEQWPDGYVDRLREKYSLTGDTAA